MSEEFLDEYFGLFRRPDREGKQLPPRTGNTTYANGQGGERPRYMWGLLHNFNPKKGERGKC